MEVHPHTHTDPAHGGTSRKRFKHYLWEFLMLFLAITLGFLVENLREHNIENSRAKEFAGLLLHDLKNDTAYLRQSLAEQLVNLKQEDSLIEFLNSDLLMKNNYRFVHHFIQVATLMYFTPAFPVNFEQMKNSGSLRYFKSSELVGELSGLNRLLDEISQIFKSRNDFILQYLTPFALQNMNSLQYDIFTRKVLSENPVVNELNNKTVLPLINKVNFTKTWGVFIYEYLRQAMEKTIASILFLKKEYHL